MNLASRCHWTCWAVAVVFALVHPSCLDAQLVVENPSGKWIPGSLVEMSVAGREAGDGARIEEVTFDGQPIAFDLVHPGSEGEPIRIRIRVPVVSRPGSHRVLVRFSEETVTSAVPEVKGLALEEARRLLATRGLSAAGGAQSPPPGAFLVVTAQEPGPGARVSRGTRVAVEVASRTVVPEIVGLSVAEARHELQKRSLELFATGDPVPAAWTITTQDPMAGAIVAAGSEVTVECLVTVPDLVGRAADEFESILTSAGLRSRLVFVEPSRGLHRTVSGQEPAAGRSVPAESVVAVFFEHLADPPPHRWPWRWMALTAALAGTLGLQRARARRTVRRSFRVTANNDLDGLRRSATAPAWEGPELKLDVRLLGFPDRGRQTLEVEGRLISETQQP